MAHLHVETLPAAEGRVIIIGDVHGCAAELAAMLTAINPQADDQLVATGDLINRGPDSATVLRMVRQHKIATVLGNHELRLLNAWRSGNPSVLKSRDLPTFEQLHAADYEWIASWPHVIRIPRFNTLVVHGGFDPARPWRRQSPQTVTHIQVVDNAGNWQRRGDCPDGQLWGSLWQGPERVVFGHTPLPSIQRHPYAIGLDTGCVYGYELSAFSLPDENFYSVRAAKAYTTQ
jgi:diadenosine tetraphosphatase ApaH/serine/threonine PP2A family protein phosphatase